MTNGHDDNGGGNPPRRRPRDRTDPGRRRAGGHSCPLQRQGAGSADCTAAARATALRQHRVRRRPAAGQRHGGPGHLGRAGGGRAAVRSRLVCERPEGKLRAADVAARAGLAADRLPLPGAPAGRGASRCRPGRLVGAADLPQHHRCRPRSGTGVPRSPDDGVALCARLALRPRLAVRPRHAVRARVPLRPRFADPRSTRPAGFGRPGSGRLGRTAAPAAGRRSAAAASPVSRCWTPVSASTTGSPRTSCSSTSSAGDRSAGTTRRSPASPRTRFEGSLDSDAGHGTFIAGLIRQQCPDADILAMRIMAGDGVVPESDVLDALHMLADAPASSR